MILQKGWAAARPYEKIYTDDDSIKVLDEYAKIEKDYRYALREMCAKLENLDDYCSTNFAHNPIHHMESRIKSPESIMEKMHRRGYQINIRTLKDLIYDIAGIRVICNYVSDIEYIIKLLMQQRNLRIRIIKDYIANPKKSGYRSIHIVYEKQMFVENEEVWIPIEIQFRTIAMDMWASLEHELRYKGDGNISKEDEDNLRKYAEQLYEIDMNMQKIFESK